MRFKGLLITAALALASIARAQGGTIGGGGGGTAAAGTLTGTTLASGVTVSSLTSVTGFTFGLGTLTGGAASLVLQAGTGASRQLALQTTTSGSVATTALRFNEQQQSLAIAGSATIPSFTFATDSILGLYRHGTAGANDTLALATNGINTLNIAGGAATKITGGAGDMTLQPGTGSGRSLLIKATNAGSVAVTSLTVADSAIWPLAGRVGQPSYTFAGSLSTGFYRFGADTIGIAAAGVNQAQIGASGILRLPLLPAEGSTKNAMCWDGTTFNVTQNAAATCTVSSARFKTNIRVFPVADALRIVGKLHASSYSERQGGRLAIGIIAEQADTADWRLASRDSKGVVASTNYEEVTALLVAVVNNQQREIEALKAKQPSQAGFDPIGGALMLVGAGMVVASLRLRKAA